VAGWSTSQDELWLAVSTDRGSTWAEPVVYSPEETGGSSHPFLRPRDEGGFDAVWFGQGPSVQLGRFAANGTMLERATVPVEGGGQSDYSYFDHSPDGRVAVAYITPDDDFRFAMTNR
jgi:hypothetical protein